MSKSAQSKSAQAFGSAWKRAPNSVLMMKRAARMRTALFCREPDSAQRDRGTFMWDASQCAKVVPTGSALSRCGMIALWGAERAEGKTCRRSGAALNKRRSTPSIPLRPRSG